MRAKSTGSAPPILILSPQPCCDSIKISALYFILSQVCWVQSLPLLYYRNTGSLAFKFLLFQISPRRLLRVPSISLLLGNFRSYLFGKSTVKGKIIAVEYLLLKFCSIGTSVSSRPSCYKKKYPLLLHLSSQVNSVRTSIYQKLTGPSDLEAEFISRKNKLWLDLFLLLAWYS